MKYEIIKDVPEARWLVQPGQVIGKVTVTGKPVYDKKLRQYVECTCECGKVLMKDCTRLKSESTKYCSQQCPFKRVSQKVSESIPESKWRVKPGDICNNLTVISRPFYKVISNGNKFERREQYVVCKCVCGSEKEYNVYPIRAKKVFACGCYLSQQRSHREWYNPDEQTDGVKTCWDCKIEQPISHFATRTSNSDGKENRCKSCVKSYQMKLKFGITLEEFKQKAEDQKYTCSICCCKFPQIVIGVEGRGPGQLVIDHCHKSHKIRGLICGKCNTAIGMLKDDPKIMRNAAKYIEDFEASQKE